jgi:hypothetical protein
MAMNTPHISGLSVLSDLMPFSDRGRQERAKGRNLPNIDKTSYSYCSALTGWMFAAFIDWRATVIPATKNETSAAPT